MPREAIEAIAEAQGVSVDPVEASADQNAETVEASNQNAVDAEQMKALMARVEGQSRVIGKLESLVSKLAEAKQEPSEPVAQTATQDNAIQNELQAQLEQMKAREERIKNAEKMSQLRAALVGQGAREELVDMAAKSLLFSDGSKFAVSEDDTGAYQVQVKEGEALYGLSDWAQLYMGTDAGKLLKSRKRAAVSASNETEAQGSKSSVSDLESLIFMSKEERANVSYNPV